MRFIFYFFILLITCKAQVVSGKEYEDYYFKSGNKEFHLNVNEIKITSPVSNQIIFSEGRKTLIENKNNILVSSYAFNYAKPEYPISLYLFNKDNDEVDSFMVKAFSDLPHPYFNLTAEGDLFSFDPLTFKIKFINSEGNEEIELEKEITFEMERSVFIQSDEANIYLLSSVKPLTLSSDEMNARLYKINLNGFSIVKKDYDISTPEMLLLDGEDVIISGVKFRNMNADGSTFKLNSSLQTIKQVQLNFQNLIPVNDGYFGSNSDGIFKLDNNLNVIKVLPLSGRILKIVLDENSMIAVIHNGTNYTLLQTDADLNSIEKKKLQINEPVLSVNSAGKSLFLHTDSGTYLIE